jgi:hypothetical protein
MPLQNADPTVGVASSQQPIRSHLPFAVEDLDREIKYLASKIDAFEAERDLLAQVIAAERPVC